MPAPTLGDSSPSRSACGMNIDSPMLTADEITWIPFAQSQPDTEPSPTSGCSTNLAPICDARPRRALRYEDLVIEDLADGEAAALSRVAALTAENAILRELLSES